MRCSIYKLRRWINKYVAVYISTSMYVNVFINTLTYNYIHHLTQTLKILFWHSVQQRVKKICQLSNRWLIAGAYECRKAARRSVKLQYHLLSNHAFSKTPNMIKRMGLKVFRSGWAIIRIQSRKQCRKNSCRRTVKAQS